MNYLTLGEIWRTLRGDPWGSLGAILFLALAFLGVPAMFALMGGAK
jgi:hypothetical protein